MDHILFQPFKISLNILLKKDETVADNSPTQIHTNKFKNWVVFKIKTSYKLKSLSKETIKLLGSKKIVIDNDKNGENVPKLETVDIILMHLVSLRTVINKYEKFYLPSYLVNNLDK